MTPQNKPSNRKTYQPAKWQVNILTFLLNILIPMLLDPSLIQLNIYITILS